MSPIFDAESKGLRALRRHPGFLNVRSPHPSWMGADMTCLFRHLLGLGPAVINRLLVAGGIIADGRHLGSGAGEVDAQVPVKIVIGTVLVLVV